MMKKYLIAGVALILLCNMVVLLGVSHNRGDQPLSSLTLTERELRMPLSRHSSDGSSLILRFMWQTKGSESTTLQSQKKLKVSRNHYKELGFESPLKGNEIPALAYAVLEFNGDAYHDALNNMQETFKSGVVLGIKKKKSRRVTEKDLLEFEQRRTRLYVVDVGVDPSRLRSRYSDKSIYAIVKALVQPFKTTKNEGHQWWLRINNLLIEEITVPLEKRTFFDSLKAKNVFGKKSTQPRYQAEVFWGQRFEPWLGQLNKIEDKEAESTP